MLIILVVFSLISKSYGQTPNNCFYSQRFTFFKGNTIASPQRIGGYNFNVSWESAQASIINSSLFYTVARSQRISIMNYEAKILSTTHAGGTVMINPLNGSELIIITMNIVLLKYCSATARLLVFQYNSISLSAISLNFYINTGITFRDSTSNYKYEIFVTDFDGYPINGSTSFAFHSILSPISLNTNLHRLSILAIAGPYSADYIYLNRIRYTYVVIDISSFLLTPITQNNAELWISSQSYININQDFQPFADSKCMLGIKTYILISSYSQDYNLSISNSTNYSLTYRYRKGGGMNIIPTLFCIGFCKERTGRSSSNICSPCSNTSITCSNQSYLLTCIQGYFLQPIVSGTQKCFLCMIGCRICTNYSYCIECEPPNLSTELNNCQKCENNSRLAGGICSSVPGCSRAQSVGGLSICRSCSTREYFQIDPILQKCICKNGYKLQDYKCIEYCGDGILISQECDDNNSANSDGCSSECKKQIGYNCSRKTSASASECIFVERVSIQLISIKRVKLQNRIILIFRVLPPQLKSLSSQFIKGNLSTNLSVRLESVTAKGEFITVQADFDQDIQDKQAIFTLNFNDPSVVQKYASLLIRFKSDTKLVKFQRIQLAKIIKYIFSLTILCVVLIFFVSLPFHKMIGLETLLPFQIIYFLFLLTHNQTQLFSLFQYYSGSALNFLFYFNGQSFVRSSFSNSNNSISNNQNFSLIFTFFLSYSTFFISLLGFIIYILKDKQPICNKKIEKLLIFWHNRISLPIFSWFLVPLLILKPSLQINKSQIKFQRQILVFQCYMTILVIFYECKGAFTTKSSFVQSIEKHSSYIPTALGFLFIVSMILSASFMEIISSVEPWIFSLCSLGLINLIYFRPYKKALHNSGVIMGVIQIMFFVVWSILRSIDSQMRNEQNQILGIFICFCLATTSIIIGVGRVVSEAVRQYRQKSHKEAKEYSSTLQKQNVFQMNLKARYETNYILPQHLKHININFMEKIPLQNFIPIQSKKNSQLKKYLMRKIEATKKNKQSISD